VLLEASQEALKGMDFLRITPAAQLHVTLLRNRMLQHRKTPKRFVPYYEAFDANRRYFATQNTAAWEKAELPTRQVSADNNVLAFWLEKPDWLYKERGAAREFSGIDRRQLAFKSNEYRPHVTLGTFTGTAKDSASFFEAEAVLIKTIGSSIGSVVLDPLRLECGVHSWEFKPKQVSVPQSTVQAPCISVWAK
jgi:hypothetical protein